MSDWIGALIEAASTGIQAGIRGKPGKSFGYEGLYTSNPVLDKVIMSRKAGIHPLIGLGANVNWNSGVSSPLDWSNVGSSLGDFAGGLYDEIQQNERRSIEDKVRAEQEKYARGQDAIRETRESERAALDARRQQAEIDLINAQRESIIQNMKQQLQGGASRYTFNGESLNFDTWPNAQRVQDVYGDWVEGPYGVTKFINEQWLKNHGGVRGDEPSNLRFFQ